jgi:hypothetical protein
MNFGSNTHNNNNANQKKKKLVKFSLKLSGRDYTDKDLRNEKDRKSLGVHS